MAVDSSGIHEGHAGARSSYLPTLRGLRVLAVPGIFAEIALLLLYWAIRLHNLLALPLFLDEAGHLYLAQRAWQIKHIFDGAGEGRLFHAWWYAIFWPFANGDFVARAGSLLLGTAGLAALIAAGRALFAREVGWAAAAIYIILPAAFFFERMLLADSLTAPLVALLLWASVRLVRARSRAVENSGVRRGSAKRPFGVSRVRLEPRLRPLVWPAITAVILWTVLLTKISNLVFLVIPGLTALLATRRPIRAMPRTAAAYGLTALALLPLLALLIFRLHSSLGLGIAQNKLTPSEMPGHIVANSQTLFTYAVAYLSPPLAVLIPLLAIAAVVMAGHSGALVTLAVVIPLGVATAITRPPFYESRFFAPIMPGIALTIAAGAWAIGRAVEARWARGTSSIALLALWALVGWHGLPFLRQGWTMPSALTLPSSDRRAYIEEFPSGFGWPETRDFFRERSRAEAIEVFVLDFGGWQRLETYLYKDRFIAVKHTEPWELAAALRASVAAHGTYIVVDEPFLDEQLADLKKEIRLESVVRFTKPGGRAAVVIYRVIGTNS